MFSNAHIFRHCWDPQYSVSVVPEVQSGDPWESPGPFQGTSKVTPFFMRLRVTGMCFFTHYPPGVLLHFHRLHDVKDQAVCVLDLWAQGLSQPPHSAM